MVKEISRTPQELKLICEPLLANSRVWEGLHETSIPKSKLNFSSEPLSLLLISRATQLKFIVFLPVTSKFMTLYPIIYIFLIVKLYLVKVKVAQSCLTLCNPMDYTVLGILQARILEWVAFAFSRGSSQPINRTQVLHCRQVLYQLSHKGGPRILKWVAYPFSSGSC